MMSKTILCTVAEDRYGRKGGIYGATQKHIEELFRNSNFGIDIYFMLTWKMLTQSAFYTENKTLLDDTDASRNGRAYKPYCIKVALSLIDEGDFLIYSDCSPEIWEGVTIDERFSLETLQANCRKANDILTCFVKWSDEEIKAGEFGKHTHRLFTTNLCMDVMQMRFYEDCYMNASGMFVTRKTPVTVKFVDEWVKWNCIDKCCSLGDMNIPNDVSYWDAESHLKSGHRHDQSIAGLLLNSMGWKFAEIRYNEINPYNPLQYALPGELELIDSLPKIEVGDYVQNKEGTLMRVWRIDPGEKYVVGKHEQSCYNTQRKDLKLVIKKEHLSLPEYDHAISVGTSILELLAEIFTPQIFYIYSCTVEMVQQLLLNNEDCILIFGGEPTIQGAEDLLKTFSGWNYKFSLTNAGIVAMPIIVPYAHKKND